MAKGQMKSQDRFGRNQKEFYPITQGQYVDISFPPNNLSQYPYLLGDFVHGVFNGRDENSNNFIVRPTGTEKINTLEGTENFIIASFESAIYDSNNADSNWNLLLNGGHNNIYGSEFGAIINSQYCDIGAEIDNNISHYADPSYNTIIASNNCEVSGYTSVLIGCDNCSFEPASSPAYKRMVAINSSGCETTTSGDCTIISGLGIDVDRHAMILMGNYNQNLEESEYQDYSVIVVGNGSDNSQRSNSFSISQFGNIYCSGRYNSSGADYGEFVEWLDQNPKKEDRAGYFVTLAFDNKDQTMKIQKAISSDEIYGIVSGNASIIGNSFKDTWKDQYITDVYGRPVLETKHYNAEYDKENHLIKKEHDEIIRKINPKYNANKKYIPRQNRPEWDVVGMLGQIVVNDDGTCKVGQKCKCNDNSVATLSDDNTGYMVLERLDKSHVRIWFK